MPQPQDIYLNNSNAADIGSLPGVDADQAKSIVEARPFESWSDLKRADLGQDAISALQACGAKLGEAPSGPIGEAGSGGSGGSPAGNLGRA